jgi:hypothetical protein
MNRNINILIILCSLILAITGAFIITGKLPSFTETLTITALGQKNPLSQSDEIAIKSINTGRKPSLIPVRGKWFWQADYMWRNEMDSRQPPGTTRFLEFAIPVGRGRSVSFKCGDNKGFVEISLKNEKILIDTFAPEETDGIFDIVDSEEALLIKEKNKNIVSFILIMVLVAFLAHAVLRRLFLHKKSIFQFLRQNRFYLAIAGLAFLMFATMVSTSGECSFWVDEIHSISIASGGKYDLSPPLFLILLSFWYRIVPYGERWLLLLPEFIASLTVFCIGVLVNFLSGKRAGVFAAILCSTTLYLARQGNNIRYYSLSVLFLVLVIFVYSLCIKQRGHEKPVCVIFYGLLLAGLVLSHYINVLLFALFLSTDILLYFRKKISGKFVFSYLLATVLFSPIVLFSFIKGQLWSFWPALPNLEIFKWTVYSVLDNDKLIMTLYLAGLIVLFSKLMAKDITVDDIPLVICSGIPPFMLGAVFVYSRYINQGGSIFVERYFSCIIPAVIITCSYCFEKLYTAVINNTMQNLKTSIAMLLLVFILRFPVFLTNFRADPEYLHEPLKSGTYWLRSQNDIYLDTTAVLVDKFDYYNFSTGWREYYVKKIGRRTAGADVFTIIEEPDNRYEKIYHFFPNTGNKVNYEEYLEKNYKKTQELSHLGISVYERKEG